MAAVACILALLLCWPAGAAAQGGRPNAVLRQALRASAGAVLREGRALMDLAEAAGPEGAALREGGLRLMERAAMMAATAEGLSVQTEQAARSVRGESAALTALAKRMLGARGALLEAGRRLLAEAERLKAAISEAPVLQLPEPFEGLATGLVEI